jgi:predicted alpha/beta hydrolase
MNQAISTGETETRSVTAADGYRLAATRYPAGDRNTVVLINSATAVPRRFYQRFASYIQDHGWNAVTYDYRT